MNRAYSTLEIKAVEDSGGKRTFTGIASTPSTDRMGDVVDPKGAQFKLPIPLLWQHDSREPIGWITAAKVTDKGIEVSGEVANIPEESALKTRLQDAWLAIKHKLVRGLSIGFNSIESARIDGTYGLHFTKWEWLELSAVTIPANQDASILAIKSADSALLAASGRVQRSIGNHRPASGITSRGNTMKTLKELREDRELKMARLAELAETAKTAELSAEEETEFDALEVEVKTLDGEIRKARFDYLNSSTATPVSGKSASNGAASRGPGFTMKKTRDEDFPGQNFTRMVIAKALAARFGGLASAIAENRWGKTDPTLVAVVKANEVAGGSSISGEWGAELVSADSRYTGDFITYLQSQTVFDRLPLRNVPANVTVKGQDGVATGYWVGETNPIPTSTVDFSTVNLTPLKVAAMAVVSNELLRDSSPSAEMLVRDALVQASTQRVDTTFLSASAAVSGVSPAGILNGVTAGTSAGTDAAAVLTDIKTLYRNFITEKNASGLYMVMNPSQALAIGLLQNALGLDAYPGLGATGGTLRGTPVVTGDNVEGNDIILLKPSDIYRIGDTGVEVSVSREATIEMSSAPVGESHTPTAQTQAMVNMFQTENTAIKVVRSINFAKRRSTAVAFIGDADYDGVES